MTVGEISHFLFTLAWEVMQLQIPVGQYRITFLELFIAVMVLGICMRLVNRALEREEVE
jgi:hypothetical protein